MTRRNRIRRQFLATLVLGVAATARADPPAERPIDAPHGMRVIVKMIGPVTQPADLQAICVLRHDPAGDKYIEAMADFNGRLGGLLASLRDRGEFAGDPGETLLFTPPPNSIAPKRVLLIGVGDESKLTPDAMRMAGAIAAREALRLGAAHVAWAPTMRDQGSTRVGVGDGDRAFAEGWVLAYDTAKRMQAQRLSPSADVADVTIEAGPKFIADASAKVRAGVAAAAAAAAQRSDAAYSSAK
jgi:hypothetical protein